MARVRNEKNGKTKIKLQRFGVQKPPSSGICSIPKVLYTYLYRGRVSSQCSSSGCVTENTVKSPCEFWSFSGLCTAGASASTGTFFFVGTLFVLRALAVPNHVLTIFPVLAESEKHTAHHRCTVSNYSWPIICRWSYITSTESWSRLILVGGNWGAYRMAVIIEGRLVRTVTHRLNICLLKRVTAISVQYISPSVKIYQLWQKISVVL